MSDIIYCPNRKCERIECLRHNKNTPFNIMISRFSENPKQDKEGKCKEYVDEYFNENNVTVEEAFQSDQVKRMLWRYTEV